MYTLLAAYNESKILFLGNWGPKWLFLFGILAALVLFFTWLDLSPMRPGRRRILLALRASTLLLAIAFAAEPALELRNVEREPNHIAIVLDDSASGRRRAHAKQPLQEVVRAHVRPLYSAQHDALHRFDFCTLGANRRPTTHSAGKQRGTRSQKTNLLRAREQLRDRYGPGKLGGVVLVS